MPDRRAPQQQRALVSSSETSCPQFHLSGGFRIRNCSSSHEPRWILTHTLGQAGDAFLEYFHIGRHIDMFFIYIFFIQLDDCNEKDLQDI